MIPGTRDAKRDDWFSDEVLQKAKTARMYIEHLYRSQSQNFRERQDRFVQMSSAGLEHLANVYDHLNQVGTPLPPLLAGGLN
jgi:hypothetical protein